MVLLALTLGCGEEDIADTQDSALDSGDTAPWELAECEVSSDDPFDLLGLSVSGDTLAVEVAYSGGCEEHVFEACIQGLFLYTDPPTVPLDIGHESNDDPCEAYPSETVEFDLSLIRERWFEATGQSSGEVLLQVDGREEISWSW